MEIPRQLLDEMTAKVNILSGKAQRKAALALERIIAEWDGVDIAALRKASIEVLEAVEFTYTGLEAAVAAEHYDAMRKAQGVRGKYTAVAKVLRDPKALDGAVRAIVQTVVDTGTTERFVAGCTDRVDADCRRAANRCIAYNASKDPAKPSYARVPSGANTCGFCLMLASFGAHYTSQSAASHAHTHCDCRIVPVYSASTTIEGYDQMGMYERYSEVVKSLGGTDGIEAAWDALPAAERKAYAAEHGGTDAKARAAWTSKTIAAAIEDRGGAWFMTGEDDGGGADVDA